MTEVAWHALQTLELHGVNSSWDLGYAQGRHFGAAFRGYLNSSNDLQSVLLPYCADPTNGTHCDAMRRNAERAFPDGVAELRGLAAGSRLVVAEAAAAPLEAERGSDSVRQG